MGCSASKAATAAVSTSPSPKKKGASAKPVATATSPTPPPKSGNTPPKNKSSAESPLSTNKPTSPRKETAVLETSASMQTTGTATAASRKSFRSMGGLKRRNSSEDETATVYKLLAKVQRVATIEAAQESSTLPATESTLQAVQDKILKACATMPSVAAYQNPTTKSTPLHMAVRLMDYPEQSQHLPAVMQGLIRAHADAVRLQDAAGNIPLHYALAPTPSELDLPAAEWKIRAEVLQLLLAADIETSMEYLQRQNVQFDGPNNDVLPEGGATTVCTPFYRALQALPDDFDRESPTVIYCAVLKEALPAMVEVSNESDGDSPLALLYRRFTRQFDLAEKFFAGDNSRPEVVQHRRRYKTAAGNTWKIIECLLRPEPPRSNHPLQWRLLHRAVQVETPPDLLRYIVETNAEDLQQQDQAGNLPLHYAAQTTARAVYYNKFVTDELLYKFPESASVPNGEGQLALALAVQAKKPWIGGGLQSLFDAYPAAMEHVDLSQHEYLRKVFSEDGTVGATSPSSPEEKKTDSAVRDEPHDAIMLVQQPNVPVQHVVNAMWAHEEDAGLQMLACVALARKVRQEKQKDGLLRIALSAVSSVVNAMKAHPNEVIVQEKASHVLALLAPTDGQRELSFVASGAVAALVGALQAHVSDASVQEEAAAALAAIVLAGGAERATIVASVSGLTALVNALAAHPDAVGVQREACRALACILPFGEEANLPKVCKSQTEPLLQAAASQFPVECGPLVEKIMPHL